MRLDMSQLLPLQTAQWTHACKDLGTPHLMYPKRQKGDLPKKHKKSKRLSNEPHDVGSDAAGGLVAAKNHD